MTNEIPCSTRTGQELVPKYKRIAVKINSEEGAATTIDPENNLSDLVRLFSRPKYLGVGVFSGTSRVDELTVLCWFITDKYLSPATEVCWNSWLTISELVSLVTSGNRGD